MGLYLAGSRLDGIVLDNAITDDPQEIIRRFAPEFEKRVLLALMSDW